MTDSGKIIAIQLGRLQVRVANPSRPVPFDPCEKAADIARARRAFVEAWKRSFLRQPAEDLLPDRGEQ